jgi:antitoxin (DNA-binding transcriptional repressor) of toxin-antitoxin stability system
MNAPSITVSVRELHARTGHYVRKAAARQRIVVTDRGKPVAELQRLRADPDLPRVPWAGRRLLPEFAAVQDHVYDGKTSTELVAEDREERPL